MNKTALAITAALLASPALAQQAPSTAASADTAAQPSAGAATSAATPQVTVGAVVKDTSGAQVGTISAVSGSNATIDTGTVKAAVPTTSFAAGASGGLVMSMTKAQLEAAVAQAKPTIAVGNSVVGPQGNPVGTVSAVNGDLVTVQTTASTKVQLPSNAFAQKSPGTLAISLTAAQLEAAAKNAAGAGK